MSDSMQRMYLGDPFEYAMNGIDEISGSTKRSHDTLADAIQEKYESNLSVDTGKILKRVNSSSDPSTLIGAIKIAGLNNIDEWSGRFTEDALSDLVDDVDNPGLGEAMRLIDGRMNNALCPRSSSAATVVSKSERDHIYIPELIEMADGGTVYMAKTLSSAAKVRMAWDLNASNQVVVVDEYDIWEQLLGWEKLKCLPHGKNKIREELGDQLSDSVLQMVAGNDTSTNSDTKDTSDTSSRGRRTRTKPSEEVLNIAKGSAHKRRNRMKSKDIYDSLEDSNTITHTGISTLVLFPSTVDLNMTDHWWVAGRRSQDNGYVAIANCNKGTFEYLNQLDSVWHIEDYLNQASNYEFDTNTGPVTMNTVSTKNLVIHIVSEKTKSRLGDGRIIKNMPSAITEYVENEMFSRIKPELPHQDDMVYAPITEEESFWLRPMLRKEQDPKLGDAVIFYGDVNVRDLGNTSSISSDYWLYSRARLPNWDFDAIELKKMDKASIYFDLDSGGYEMIEMLGELHDMGKCPFSKSPKSRW